MISSTTKYLLIVALLLTSSCNWLRPIDPSAPLNEKWSKVEKWVPSNTRYIVIADINKISLSPFYKEVFTKDPGKKLSLISFIDPASRAGIVVFADDLVFIGGRFEKNTAVQLIKGMMNDDNKVVAEERYNGKTIYRSESSDSAFAFLEKYLICYGDAKNIKTLMDEKAGGKITPPKVDTSFPLWAHINGKLESYSKITDATLTAELDGALKLKATAPFATEKEAIAVEEEAVGIKTLKTLEYADEPWISDIIDGISIARKGAVVEANATFDPASAGKLLRRMLK